MRRFVIYLIKEEFCMHYYGNEGKLVELFQDYERHSSFQNKILKKQIDYVTRSVPVPLIQSSLKKELGGYPHYSNLWNSHYLEMKNSQASLSVHDDFLLLRAKGTYECEMLFFEQLKKHDPYFLAMDFENNNYGWLNPIKQRNLV